MRFLTAALIGLCAFIGVSSTVEAKTQWHQLKGYTFDAYVREFGKVYANKAEHNQRQMLFAERLRSIMKHNAGSSSYKKGVNQLTDRTHQELHALLGYKPSSSSTSSASSFPRHASPVYQAAPASAVSASNSVDWRQTPNIVGPVKDQGQCGSCWAFGTTATVESHYALKSGLLTVLSTQQILDCALNVNHCGGTGGCGGGTPEVAYEKLIAQGGQASEWTYPYLSYHGKDYPTCSFSPTTAPATPVVAPITGYVVLDSNNGDDVKQAVTNVGPLAVNVDASDWSAYESGVFTGCNMNSPDINHVVQLVGFGTDAKSGLDYWIIRNSWTPTWGEQGYIRLARYDGKERCGVDVTPSDGTGCTGGPANVTVCGECGVLYDTSYPTF